MAVSISDLLTTNTGGERGRKHPPISTPPLHCSENKQNSSPLAQARELRDLTGPDWQNFTNFESGNMAAVEMLRAELPPIHGADLTAQMVQAVMVLSRILLVRSALILHVERRHPSCANRAGGSRAHFMTIVAMAQRALSLLSEIDLRYCRS
jgi:hypothetical protein